MIAYRARWLVPVSRPPVEQGTVVEDAGRIVYAGPSAGAPPTTDAVDLGEAVLLPGLVNVHTHLELTVMRGYLEHLPFRRWLERLTNTRRALLDEQALLQSARLGIAEGLLAGVTTFADTSPFACPLHAMREAGVRGVVFQEVFGPDPAQCAASLAEVTEKVERLRSLETPLVRVGVSPHAPYSVSDELFAATARFARAEQLPMAVHVAESAEEMAFVRQGQGAFAESHRQRGIPVAPRGTSSIELLERAGVLEQQPLLIHCVQVDAGDVRLIAEHRCPVAHCPASNAKLGHGIAPLAELLDAGVRVGLGSDSVASNNRMDVLDEARLAVLMQRARFARHDVLSAQTALELATIGGARALGLDREIGSLDVGKSADFVAFSLEAERSTPVYDPAAALVFAVAGRAADVVVVAGRVLVREGALTAPLGYNAIPAIASALRSWSAHAEELR